MISAHPRINLRRGLFRIWIVAALVWAAYWAWYFAHCYAAPGSGWAGYGPWSCPPVNLYRDTILYFVILAWLVLPSLIAFIGACTSFMVIRWVICGFVR
jgi:hypothetical protein